jgi:hypothetical protein
MFPFVSIDVAVAESKYNFAFASEINEYEVVLIHS